MINQNNDLSISPTERMKRNFNRRRWSDSPTLLQGNTRPSGMLQITADHELTQSLHDLTEPILQPVSKITSASQSNLSTPTLQSEMGVRTKSQDSGFNKSASWLSLHGSNRKYSHVESKVKKYVRDIKDAEALRKQSVSKNGVNTFVSPNAKESKPHFDCEENVDDIIDKLQSDIRDKDALIRTLQGSYEDLLLKHAEAENKIDRLRLRSLQSPPARPRRSRHFTDCFDFQPLISPPKNFVDLNTSFPDTSKLSSPKETAEDSCVDGSFTPSISESFVLSPSPQSSPPKSESIQSRSKEVVISAPLGPIQKLYSTSVRLDRVLEPLSHFSLKSNGSKSTTSIPEIQSSVQIIVAEENQPEASNGHSEEFGAKSNLYYTTAETGTNNLYHMTTDTGIEDCIQSATDKDTGENEKKASGRLPVGLELNRIPNIPNEDAFSKVQRWRDSLPNNIIDRKVEPRKTRSRRPALPKKTVGVQTTDSAKNFCLCSGQPPLYFCYPNSFAPAPAETSDDDYADSLEITDCDNYSLDISQKSPKKKLWSTNMSHKDRAFPRSRSVEPLSRHRCCGECKTCGNAIVAETQPSEFPPSTSYLSPKGSLQKKLRPVTDKTEKIRRDTCQRKTVRCARVAGTQVTRAVLLDMLLNVQSAHSCCCCCQHTWRGRQPESPLLREESNKEKASENALQQCLAEIQKIAWDLNAKLAQSHAGLMNLSCRKKE